MAHNRKVFSLRATKHGLSQKEEAAERRSLIKYLEADLTRRGKYPFENESAPPVTGALNGTNY